MGGSCHTSPRTQNPPGSLRFLALPGPRKLQALSVFFHLPRTWCNAKQSELTTRRKRYLEKCSLSLLPWLWLHHASGAWQARQGRSFGLSYRSFIYRFQSWRVSVNQIPRTFLYFRVVLRCSVGFSEGENFSTELIPKVIKRVHFSNFIPSEFITTYP